MKQGSLKLTVLAAMIGLVALAVPAGPALANDYEVWSCRGPEGQPLSIAAWKVQASDALVGDVSTTNDCRTGGPMKLEISTSGIPATRKPKQELIFDVPYEATIGAYRINRAIRTAPPSFGLSYNYAGSVREAASGTASDSGCASVIDLAFPCNSIGSEVDPADAGNTVDRPTTNLSGLRVFAGCLSVGCDAPPGGPSARFTFWGSTVSIIDNDAPQVTSIEGPMAEEAPVNGRAGLFIEATDGNAGISLIELQIDGAPHLSMPTTTSPSCAVPYQVPRPCPDQTGRLFQVDTTSLDNGEHTASGRIVDAAGNSTAFGPLDFTVANDVPDPPDVTNGIPVVTDPVLRLDRQLVEHRPGRPATVTGTLKTTSGQPVVGAQLGVVSTGIGIRTVRDSRLPSVVTSASGRFRISQKALGARQVAVTFAPVVGGPVTRTARVAFRSKLALQLRANPRRVKLRQPVAFRGQLAGGGSSVAGARVEIQAVVDGRWSTVANVKVKPGGKFIWKYRFKYVEGDALFSFRALVSRTPGWPWPTIESKRIKVRIDGDRR